MFTMPFKKNTEPSALEAEITRLFEKLQNHAPDTEEYDKVSDQLAKLYKLKEIDSKRRVSPDALVGAATNLAGILLVINFEHVGNIITTKAFGMIAKNVR